MNCPCSLPLIYTNLAAAGIFIVACLVWLVPELIVMPRQMAKVSRQEASVQDRSSLGILIGLQWVGLTVDFLLAWRLPSAAIPWQWIALLAGVAFILLGVALRWYSIRTLGQYFTRDVAVSADQQLVQHGPYRWVRHPAYSGTILTMLGVGLGIANWAGLACLLICIFLGHLYRVSVEEKALVSTLGQPYIEYVRRTRRLIPWVF